MLRPAYFLRIVVTLGSVLAFASQAQSRVVEAEEQKALRWLRQVPLAPQTLNYSGTFVHQQGDHVRASRITHIVQGTNELEKLEVLDGPPREYVRRNGEIVYYAPDEKAILIEQRVTPAGFPALLSTEPAELLPYYQLRIGESGRVAGHDCRTLLLTPKDNLRYGYRLCLEKSSGLLLRVQTLADGRVVEQIGFAQLALGSVSSQLVRPSYANVQDWRVEKSVLPHAELSGLMIGFMPPGFEQIAAVKHFLTQTAAEVRGEGTSAASRVGEVVQIVFSDGLAAISVFIEPGSQGRMEGSSQQGAVSIIGRRLGDFWLTIVGEVPAIAVRKVANSVEFKEINKSEP
jgi:sigma-E factor negative regulatory protein RseB